MYFNIEKESKRIAFKTKVAYSEIQIKNKTILQNMPDLLLPARTFLAFPVCTENLLKSQSI